MTDEKQRQAPHLPGAESGLIPHVVLVSLVLSLASSNNTIHYGPKGAAVTSNVSY